MIELVVILRLSALIQTKEIREDQQIEESLK
jgi:hypothetical protein